MGHILDDGRQPEEGKKYQMAVKLGKKVMNEGEFEKYCKIKFQNPDFLLGRKTKKDATAGSEDHFITGDNHEDKVGDLMDISDIIDGNDNEEKVKVINTRDKTTPSTGSMTP